MVEWTLAAALGLRDGTMPQEASAYRVFVRDLVLSCSIGVHAWEKRTTQQVRVNAELLDVYAQAESVGVVIARRRGGAGDGQ